MRNATNCCLRLKTVLVITFALLGSTIRAQENFISFSPEKENFCFSASNKKITILLAEDEHPAVKNIAGIFANDLKMVTGATPDVKIDKSSKDDQVIIIGTLGNSKLIDALVKKGTLNVAAIQNKWESGLIEVISHPKAGIKKALVIVGSDKRGTIYSMLEVSKQMGVSPWYWWADVPVVKKPEVFVKPGRYILNEPKVKYRGFFINDEAPALSGWSKEKFGGFNHLFYEKVFELLLRMRGNYLWPAMWGSAFNADDSLNQQTADNFGVVMGTSHHEPMVRAHDEWRRFGSGPWNYEKNEQKLKEFWTQGIKRMGTSENIVSLGMRGDGDMPMSQESNIALLERIVKDQREIIQNVTGKAPEKTPQMWALYKEVQDYYDKGMRVPDDVTLLLCDDNWGNIRKIPNLNDKPRKGGYGIYYHYDYVGGPRNYKWLNTNSIARVWEQMHLAYEYGVKQVWIVNVGDIKPMEFPLQFFLDYAWDPDKIQANQLRYYTKAWSENQFGKEYADSISNCITTYLKYSSRRKPELLSPETYSITNYNEADRIIQEYKTLLNQAQSISKKLPQEYHDAFYQLVLHPIKALANLNELYVTVAKNRLHAFQGRASANNLAQKAKELFLKDSLITLYYNKTLANGKWNHMMDQTHIGYTYWQQPPLNRMPKVELTTPEDTAILEMGVACGDSYTWKPYRSAIELPQFYSYDKTAQYFEIFNRGTIPFTYFVESFTPKLRVVPRTFILKGGESAEIGVEAKWEEIKGLNVNIPVQVICTTGQTVKINVIANNYDSAEITGFAETNGYISMEAEHFTKKVENNGIQWLIIPDLGKTLSGITPIPVTSNRQIPDDKGSYLEYEVFLTDTGIINIHTLLSPNLNFHNKGLQYGISIDNELPQIIDVHSDLSLKTWEKWVSDNIIDKKSSHKVVSPGKHVIRFRMIDPGLVLQKIIIDTGGLKDSYLGPPESPKL